MANLPGSGLGGRPRLPVEAKKQRGTFRPGRENPNAPEPEVLAKTPPCPAHLQGEARKEWRKIARFLVGVQVLSVGDLDALAAYCSHFQIWLDAKAKVAQAGAVILNPKTQWFEISPYLKVADDASTQMRRFMVEFGMTPASRSRVSAAKPSPPAADPDAQYFDAPTGKLRSGS